MIEIINGHTHGFRGPNKVYIGRASPRLGLRASPLANPYHMHGENDRARVIALYREWLWKQMQDKESPQTKELLRILTHELDVADVQLVCYCSPRPCHGDIILSAIRYMEKA